MADPQDKRTAEIRPADKQRDKRESEPPPRPKPVADEKAKHDVEDDDRFQATDN